VLSQPRANLFDVVIGDSSGCIVSKKAVEQRGADIATKPVGSGPYQLVSLERQKGAILRRNPGYTGRSRTTRRSRSASSRTQGTTDLALRSGELDLRRVVAFHCRSAALRARPHRQRAAEHRVRLASA
jgi:peptide/nickel transport system substrate-binding protein